MYKISEEVVLYEEDKKYLVNTVNGKVFELNDVASRIVEGINENRSLEEIKNMISSLFPDVTYEQISLDVDNYIKILIDSQSIIRQT
ncbi:MAG: PqqD family protein [Lachnospiraceae bacterium]|nr:PqqD family protein [Lachnospiraceae bacterium]